MLEIDQIDRVVQALSARMHPIEGKIKKYLLEKNFFAFFNEYKKDPEPIIREGLPLLNSPEIVIQKYSVITPNRTTLHKEKHRFYRDYNKKYYVHYKKPGIYLGIHDYEIESFLEKYKSESELIMTKYFLVQILSVGVDKSETEYSINNFITWLTENNYEITYRSYGPSPIDDFVNIDIPVRTLRFFNLF